MTSFFTKIILTSIKGTPESTLGISNAQPEFCINRGVNNKKLKDIIAKTEFIHFPLS